MSQNIPFLEIKNLEDLAAFFGYTKKRLCYIIFISKNTHYSTFDITTKGNKSRRIHAPKNQILFMQNIIFEQLRKIYTPFSNVHGYIKGRGIITNATPHLQQRWLINLDISDFYDSIHFGRVMGLFRAKPFSFPEEVARALASIITYEGKLPQGAKTSPIISNMICLKLDKQIRQICAKNRCYYTRYSDDITISTSLKNPPSNLVTLDPEGKYILSETLSDIFLSNKFKINEKKVHISAPHRKHIVTGLTVNRRLNVSKKYLKTIRAIVNNIEKSGYVYALEIFNNSRRSKNLSDVDINKFKMILKGRLGFIGQVRGWGDPKVRKLYTRLYQIDKYFTFPEPPIALYNGKIVIHGEGKTDYMYIEAALKTLQSKGLYTDLDFDFSQTLPKYGSSELYRSCEMFASAKHLHPTIFIFDRDEKTYIEKCTQGEKHFKPWGNNVFSICTPIPEHRQNDMPFCIEMYFLDEDIVKPSDDNRRLFFNSEFNKAGIHSTKKYRKHNADKDGSLVTETPVYLINDDSDTPYNYRLSKNDFADRILKQINPYDSFDFSGFRALFDVIEEIRLEYLK